MSKDRQNKNQNSPGPVLIFDSGLGGLTVQREIIKQMPGVHIVYCADNAGFPYGDWEEAALVQRIVKLMGALVARVQPSAIVIACNTATTIALNALRAAFTTDGPGIPIVGTVPAIKVAAEESKSRIFSVLATPGTVTRDYTKALMTIFAGDCDVTLVGVEQLAAIAEQKMWGQDVDLEFLSDLVAPAFKEINGKRTDTIVLGCTHYPLLEDELRDIAPWPVRFIDPASAIARRLIDVLAGSPYAPDAETRCDIVFTGDDVDISELPNRQAYGIQKQTVLKFPI